MLLGLSLFCPTTITVQPDQASQLWVSLARVAIHWHEQHLPFMGWGASRSSRFENNLWTDQLALHSQSASYGSVSTHHSSSAPFSQQNAIPLLVVHATLSHPVLPHIWAPAFSLWTVSGGLRHSDRDWATAKWEKQSLIHSTEKHPPLNWTWCSIVQLWAGRQLEAYSVQGGKRVIDYFTEFTTGGRK